MIPPISREDYDALVAALLLVVIVCGILFAWPWWAFLLGAAAVGIPAMISQPPR